jgi:peroxiredoxin Q/BCP
MRRSAIVASVLGVAALAWVLGGCASGTTLEAYHSPAAQEAAAAARSPVINMPAPDFTLKDQNDQDVTLSKLRGHWVVLYFYPKDDTPGCTCEATEFTKVLGEFKHSDALIYGVSSDSVHTHQVFVKQYKLNVNLLSDPNAEVMRNYGAYVDARLGAKTYQRVIRTSLIIDPEGIIRWDWPEVIPDGHAQRVAEKLNELKAMAASGKLPPAKTTAQ